MLKKRNEKISSCIMLLKEYKNTKNVKKSQKIIFTGVGEKDVYNITSPFEDNGVLTVAGRVEARDSELSEVIFFKFDDGKWMPRNDVATFKLQDPFITKINGELIFGGVEIETSSENPEKIISWKTQFYRGENIGNLKHFASGPDRMKDIRLLQMVDGTIGVFTRPQGTPGGKGQIGFIKIKSLEDLNEVVMAKATLFEDQFIAEEWGGANEPHLLSNGLIGVLGHIAYMDKEGNRHYHSMAFALNSDTLEKSPAKIITIRSDFQEGAYKRPDLIDVIFSGGLRRLGNGEAELYVGVSDAEAHMITIADPFAEYEN